MQKALIAFDSVLRKDIQIFRFFEIIDGILEYVKHNPFKKIFKFFFLNLI